MLEVVPAILPKNFRELEEKPEFLKGVAPVVQIDITDGKFAGIASWPLAKHDENFEAIVREERGMPFWEDFEFEFDLMIEDPFSFVPDLIKAGATRIVLHAESINLDNDQLLLDQLRTDGLVSVGIAFQNDAEESLIREFLPFADFVQFMGISKIGFQGQAFDSRVVDRIKFIHEELPHMPVAVDGGMNLDTASLVIDAGATKIVVGSFLLNSQNPIETVRELKNLL